MNINYEYVRPEKSKKMAQMYECDLMLKNTLSCMNYSNAIVLPAKRDGKVAFGLGGVLNEEKEYVVESGIRDRFGGFYEPQEILKRNENVVYCGYLVNHWGHFLIEGIARLWYVIENDLEIDKYIFVGNLNETSEMKGNYKEFFELLGIYDKVEIINQPMQFTSVLVPELAYKRRECFAQGFLDIFNKVCETGLKRDIDINKYDKVFLSRRWFAEDTEVGVDMLDNYFERNGFLVLYPEKVTLTELIHYLENASICAAESGTLPHNFLFARNGKDIIIVERQDTINEIQIDIDRMKQNHVIYIDGYYTIYPVRAAYGPYYLVYNNYMVQFSKDYEYIDPDNEYLQEKYQRKCFKKYMNIYVRNHGYQWAFEKWQLSYMNIYYESYQESCKVLGKYLSREKTFKISQYKEGYFWKKWIKKLLYR